MTLNDAFEGQTMKPVQLMQRGSLLLLALAASLLLAFRRHNGFVLGVALALCTVIIPAIYVLARRVKEKTRQQETEQQLMAHTRAFLSTQEPKTWPAFVPVVKEPDAETLGERLLATLHTDGRALPVQAFRGFQEVPTRLAVGEPVVFDALPRRYAVCRAKSLDAFSVR
jgi:hypothetical protein